MRSHVLAVRRNRLGTPQGLINSDYYFYLRIFLLDTNFTPYGVLQLILGK